MNFQAPAADSSWHELCGCFFFIQPLYSYEVSVLGVLEAAVNFANASALILFQQPCTILKVLKVFLKCFLYIGGIKLGNFFFTRTSRSCSDHCPLCTFSVVLHDKRNKRCQHEVVRQQATKQCFPPFRIVKKLQRNDLLDYTSNSALLLHKQQITFNGKLLESGYKRNYP